MTDAVQERLPPLRNRGKRTYLEVREPPGQLTPNADLRSDDVLLARD